MFLKIFFSFSFLTWLYLPFSVPQNIDHENKKTVADSLKMFSENFLPEHSQNDELIRHTAFTLCYSNAHEQARWVSYRLTADMCNNNGEERTNDFREDKDVKKRSASLEDYKKSGYDRGHLCPAGDMGWSEQTMSESFLMSNMSPQLPGFNRGIWKRLETDVREWTKKNDELYIVTAGVLEDSLHTIGINKVAVPRYYYKVILDCHLPEYKAIAFVLPNQGSKDPVLNFAVSIDSVERLTGINFFPALPDSLENYLESHCYLEKWE